MKHSVTCLSIAMPSAVDRAASAQATCGTWLRHSVVTASRT